MNYAQLVLFSSSILMVTFIGWIRFKRTESGFLPFILCVTIASLNEIISFLLTRYGFFTTVNNNIYVLLEALLIIWQFKYWGLFAFHKYIFISSFALIIIVWITETFFTSTIYSISFYFRILYSFMIILMSISVNNNLIITCRHSLLKNPVFLTCSGFIIYFTYKILVEAFWLYGLNAGRDFRINVYLLLTWINLFVNLIYAVAFLWIPRKPQHIMLY
jgi:hypothetical protein